jgi:drug/metabolite transporter (DMT)-like permease
MIAQQRQGTIFIFLSVIGYSFFPIWVKAIQDSGLQPLDIAFWRFLFAVPVFWLLVAATRLPAPEKPLPRLQLLGMGTLLTVSALLAFLGLQRIPASTFIVIFYTYPALVAIMSMFLGERLSRVGWLALALTLVGIFLTVPDFGQGLSGESVVGLLMALLNAFSVAFYFIISSRLLRGHSSMARASAWGIVGALLPLLLIAPFRPTGAPSNPDVWANLGALAVVSTVFPVFFLNAGIQKVGPARAAILGTVEPLLTILLAVIFLGERLHPIQLVGGAFILSSVILLQVQGMRTPTVA